MKNLIRGRVHKFGDYINTDLIIPFRFKSRTNDPHELAKYAMYGIDPDFAKKVKGGDIIVAGQNFGGGSSREQAPIAIKYSGIAAVVAESFARIFFRNSFAIGLPVLEVKGISRGVRNGDRIEINIKDGKVKNLRTKKEFIAKEVTGFLRELQKTGGLKEYYRKYKKFPWEQETIL